MGNMLKTIEDVAADKLMPLQGVGTPPQVMARLTREPDGSLNLMGKNIAVQPGRITGKKLKALLAIELQEIFLLDGTNGSFVVDDSDCIEIAENPQRLQRNHFAPKPVSRPSSATMIKTATSD